MRRNNRSVPNYIEMEEVINKPWLSTKDLRIILPLGENSINNFRKTIVEEMKKNNEFSFQTRPILIPTKKVLEKLNIDADFIRSEANKMRNSK